MSNPARLQQRSPFRTQVRVRRNFPVLPPIGQVTPTPLPLSKVPSVIESTRSSLSIQNVEVECETPTEDPRDFWIRLHEHLDNELTENRTNHGNQRTLNKVVRIFVSSTFTDFFNEREVLIKKVRRSFDSMRLTTNKKKTFEIFRFFRSSEIKWNRWVFKSSIVIFVGAFLKIRLANKRF